MAIMVGHLEPQHLAVDAVYVLAIKTFRARIAHARRELGRHGIPFEFIFDFDVPDLDEVLLAKRFGNMQMPRAGHVARIEAPACVAAWPRTRAEPDCGVGR